MRDEEVSRGRECICPEVNRNKNIGEVRAGVHGGGLRGNKAKSIGCRPQRHNEGNAMFVGWPMAGRPSWRMQVGANMNKQAFTRYLKTMAWNADQTVRRGRQHPAPCFAP